MKLISGIYGCGHLSRMQEKFKPTPSQKAEIAARRRRIKKAAEARLKVKIRNKKQLALEMRKAPTKSEELFGKALAVFAGDGFPFNRSVVVHGYIADFYCDPANLVIELDGRFHKDRKQYDNRRDNVLRKYGIRTMRFSSARVFYDSAGMVSEVREVLSALAIGSSAQRVAKGSTYRNALSTAEMRNGEMLPATAGQISGANRAEFSNRGKVNAAVSVPSRSA